MKTIRSLFILLILISSLYSCTEIIEPDISSECIVLLSPPDNYHTTVSTQQFWWENMQFAEEYQLQLVTPSFEYIERLLLDTILAENKYLINLSPAQYQWRVRGLNYSYYSGYSTWTLTIDSTEDISQEIIILIEPSNKDTTNKSSLSFRWQGLYNADEYNFQMLYEGVTTYSTNTIYDTVNYTLNEGDGTYSWQVRGINTTSFTQYSTRSLYLDTRAPGAPQHIAPANNSTVQDTTIQFIWQRDDSGGSSLKDSLFIATDEFMTNLVVEQLSMKTYYSDSLGPGTYYWRLRSFDAAGNESVYSDPWKVIVQ